MYVCMYVYKLIIKNSKQSPMHLFFKYSIFSKTQGIRIYYFLVK